MLQVISIGNQSFQSIREKNAFYIDKTDLIREWWESEDVVTLITRPRRFGKTLNLNMIDCFFSVEHAGREDLFEGLSIWGEEKYRSLQGTYPVISLSFASVKECKYPAVKEKICHLITELYVKNAFLKECDRMQPQDREFFDSIGPDMSEVTAALSIYKLCDFLYRYYDKKVIVLLDEYDTPLQEAYVYGYWKELVQFIRSLFNSAFKTNPFMERAIMTGITRVSKESIFSDLNNLAVVTTTSEEYRTQFGFTEEEVFAALETFGMGAEKEKVKKWYDGFTFGGQRDIYNPWSITNFLNKKEYKTYWANTSSNSLVGKLIREGAPEIKMAVEDLLEGKQIVTPLDEEIVFAQLDQGNEAIWSLLLTSGYLKVDEVTGVGELEDALYHLSLTNLEVRKEFRRMIKRWFGNSAARYNDFIRALLMGDVKAMNYYMNKVALVTFSYFDTGKKPSEEAEPERFYHGFVLGLIAELAGKYKITSNRESGFGRYDVMMEPLNRGDAAFVLEFKVRDPEDEKLLKDTLQEALKQIEDKCYDSELIARGIPKENIRHYGFAFEGKTVLIGGA